MKHSATELPEAWRKKPVVIPEPVSLPDCDTSDPAQLAAFYSGYAIAEHHRKIVLASCRESLRAQFTLAEQKVSEARLEDLSRVHPAYLKHLADHLYGRILWEREVIKNGRGS